MKISRELAIKILKYLYENPDFKLPFFVMCQEYSPEDYDFVEIQPEERKDIMEDENYQTFQLWNKNPELNNYSIQLLSKGFIEEILKSSLENDIYNLFREYDKLYKENIVYSTDIEKYGENEFFGGKKEAFEDVLELLKDRFNLKTSYTIPEIIVIRYYEDGTFDISYNNNLKNISKIYSKIDFELNNDKHLESYQILEKDEFYKTVYEEIV